MAKKVKASKSKLYKIDGGKAKHLRISCPRCGPGVFMAEHTNRFACGRCGYTDFKKEKPAEEKPKKPKEKQPVKVKEPKS